MTAHWARTSVQGGSAGLAGFTSWAERVRGNREDGPGEGMGWSEGDPFDEVSLFFLLFSYFKIPN